MAPLKILILIRIGRNDLISFCSNVDVPNLKAPLTFGEANRVNVNGLIVTLISWAKRGMDICNL